RSGLQPEGNHRRRDRSRKENAGRSSVIMTLEILTPEKKVFSGEATSITVPGTQGSVTVLNSHATILSTLEAGEVKVKGGQGMETYPISGGVIEVLKNKVVLLAEGLSS